MYNGFIDEIDRILFEEYLEDPSAVLMEMANVRGNEVVQYKRLPFSFYFSSKDGVRGAHAIRVKILWNPSKTPSDADGYMMLHGNYEYVSGSHKYQPTGKELKIAREFFKKYKVLFAAVWENKLSQGALINYFFTDDLKGLLARFDSIKEKDFYNINHCKNLEELEKVVRENHIFNMND